MPVVPQQGGSNAPAPLGTIPSTGSNVTPKPTAPVPPNWTQSFPVERNYLTADEIAKRDAQAAQKASRQAEHIDNQLAKQQQHTETQLDQLNLTPAQAGVKDYLAGLEKHRDLISRFQDAITQGQHSVQTNIYDRAMHLPMAAAQMLPQTMAGTLFSGISEKALKSVGYSAYGSKVYFDQIHTFAGLPGAFTAAHARLMTLPDPVMRHSVTAWLNAAQRLPQDEQINLWNLMINHGDPTKYKDFVALTAEQLPKTVEHAVGFNYDTDKLVQGLQYIFPNMDVGQYGSGHGWFGPYVAQNALDQPAMTSTQFFGGFGGMPQQGSMDTAVGAVLHQDVQSIGAITNQIGKTGGYAIRRLAGPYLGGDINAAISGTVHLGTGALEYGQRAGQSTLIDASIYSRAVFDTVTGKPTSLGNVWQQMGNYAPSLSLTQTNPNQPLTQYISDNLGWMPGEHPGATDFMNLTFQWVGTAELAGAFGALRDTGRIPIDPQAPVDYMHPISGLIKQMGGLTPQEFVFTKAWQGGIVKQGISGTLDAIINDPRYAGDTEAIAGAINNSLENIDMPLARQLAQTTDPATWQSLFVNYANEVVSSEMIAALRTKGQVVDQKIVDLRQEMKSNMGPDGTGLPTTPAPEPQVLTLKNIADDATQIGTKTATKEAMFSAGNDPGYVYHWSPAAGLPDIIDNGGLLPVTPADIAIDPTAQTGVYFGDTAKGAYNSLPMASARDSALLRVPIDETIVPTGGIQGQNFGEHISQTPVPAENIEMLGKDGQWHPLLENTTAQSPFETRVAAEQAASYDQQLQSLYAERMAIKNRFSLMSDKMPVDMWPSASAYKRFISDNPTNAVERLLSDIYKRTPINLARFTEHMPRSFVFLRPGQRDWLNTDATYVTRLLRLAKTPETTIAKVIGALTDLKSGDDVFAWTQEHLSPALKEGITKGGTKSIDFRLLNPAIQIFDNPLTSREGTFYHTLSEPDPVTGRVTTTRTSVLSRPGLDSEGNVIPGTSIPIPAQSSEFLGEHNFRLPDVGRIRAASSAYRRWVYAGSKEAGASALARMVRVPFTFSDQVLNITTGVMKPTVLVPRLPALIFRISIDEMATNLMTGRSPMLFPGGFNNLVPGLLDGIQYTEGYQFVFGPNGIFPHDFNFENTRSPGVTALGDLSVNEKNLNPLGSILVKTHEPTYAKTYAPMPTDKFADNPALFATSPEARPIANGLWDRYQIANAAPETRYLAAHGPEETIAWLKDSEEGQAFMQDHMNSKLEKGSSTPEQWVAGLEKHLQEVTMGDPMLRRGVARGQMVDLTQEGLANKTPIQGVIDTAKYQRAQSAFAAADAGIREGIANGLEPHLLDQLYVARNTAMGDIINMEMQAPKTSFINMSDKRAVTDYITQKVAAGELKLPPTVMVDVSHHAGSDAADLTAMEHTTRIVGAWNHLMSRGLSTIGKVDKVGARGSLWIQAYDAEYSKLISAGWDAKRAGDIATVRAMQTTRDLLFNLQEPTMFHRDVANIFWFAPAWQRILSTWLVKIPSQFYWPIGISYLASKATIIQQAFKDAGLIKTVIGPDGKPLEQVELPFIADFINKIVGADVLSGTFAKPTGFSLGTAGLPGLSPIPDFLLGKASENLGGIFTHISNMAQPYGPDSIPGPQSIYDLWEATIGSKPPWSGLSGQYGQDVYDRARDQALQSAYVQMVGAGNEPPNIVDYSHQMDKATGHLVPSGADGTKFQTDTAAWWASLNARADQVFQGMAMGKFIGASIFPASIYATAPEKQAWTDFYQKQVIPAGFDPTGGYSTFQSNLIQHYVSQHPGSMAYSVSYTVSSGKSKPMPYVANQTSQQYYDKLRSGELKVLTPDEYQLRLQAISSLENYRAHLNAAYAQAGSTSWQKQLVSGYKVNAAVAPIQQNWTNYLALNHDVDAYLKDLSDKVKIEYGQDVQGIASQQAAEAHTLLKTIAPFFLGAGGLPSSDYKNVAGRISQLYSKVGTFGAPTTPAAKAKTWWFNKVYTPYEKAVSPLFAKAAAAASSGDPAAYAYYAEINKVNLQYNKPIKGPYGTGPTPEQYFWGNMSPEQQANARLSWGTKPPAWLTPFQLKQAGMPRTPAAQKFYQVQTDANTTVQDYLKKNNISSSSTAYTSVKAQLAAYLQRRARELGPSAVKALELSTAPPIERLVQQDYGKGNALFQQVIQVSAQVRRDIVASGSLYTGYSAFALNEKTQLERQIQMYRDPNSPKYNRQFDNLWSALGRSIPLPGASTREGPYLYEAILFGQFQSLYAKTLAAAVYAHPGTP